MEYTPCSLQGGAAPRALHEAKGDTLFHKREYPPLNPPRERFTLQASSSKGCNACRLHCPDRGVAAFGVDRRFGLLLLSAAALPILWECTVISVYRQSLQCGERSNAAFRKQSAAEKTSLAPHDSKARLLLVTSSRGSWRSHVHRTYFAQRVQFFELQTANVRGQGARPLAFSWGIKRGPFSHVREWPPLTHPCTVQGNKNQRCRAVNPQTIGSSISLVAYAFSAQSARAPARYS